MNDTYISDFVEEFINVKKECNTNDFNTAEVILKIVDKDGKVRELGKKVRFYKNITLGDDKKDLFFEETYKEAESNYMDDRFLFEHLCGLVKNTARSIIMNSDSKFGYKHNEILEYYHKRKRNKKEKNKE